MSTPINLVISLGLPSIGLALAYFWGSQVLESELKMHDHKPDYEKMAQDRKLKFMVMLMMPMTALIFALVLTFQLFVFEGIGENTKFAVSLNIGMAGFFTTLGAAIFFRRAVKDIVENPKTFGKYIVLNEIATVTVVYAFVLGYLSMIDPDRSMDHIVKANATMGAMSVGGLITGLMLASLYKNQSVSKIFGRLMVFGSIGTMISTVGFAIAFLMLQGMF